MHRKHSAVLLSAALLALVGGLTIQSTLAQPQPGGQVQSRDIRIGTIDIYLVSERIMQQPDLLRLREQADIPFQDRLRVIENELRQMETQLQVLPQTDPQVQQIMTRAQTLQTNYQSIQQERQQELERINSSQLSNSVRQTRTAANEVARRRGYTHVFSSRGFDRPIETTTVGATLQEMLARPVIVGIPEDDITDAVLDLLQLAPPAPVPTDPAAQPEGGLPIGPQNRGPQR